MKKISKRAWYIRLTNWEYWSFNTVYFPIVWYYGYLSLKARSLCFFSAANPSIEYGGFLMESKWKIHQLLPPEHTPHTQIVYKQTSVSELITKAAGFTFPIICKPDIGSRGRGVAVIHNTSELAAYHQQCPVDYLLQNKIDYPLEAGIFYIRFPDSSHGTITGIVQKEFLTVTGNGISTVSNLIEQNTRYILQHNALSIMLGEAMNEILPPGTKKILVPFGNHARGCLFIDASFRITEKLISVIDKVCKSVNGFYYGRLDIKFESWEALENGKHFAIIELNGSGSEPTHIYDPANSIVTAWKEIIRHWKLLYKISSINHKKGIKYLTNKGAKKMFRDNAAVDKLMDHFIFKPPPADTLI